MTCLPKEIFKTRVCRFAVHHDTKETTLQVYQWKEPQTITEIHENYEQSRLNQVDSCAMSTPFGGMGYDGCSHGERRAMDNTAGVDIDMQND